MLLKQSLTQACACGQALKFPEGEIRTKCSCGVIWECGNEGYWHPNDSVAPLAPILPKPVVCSVKSRAERYRNYPKSKHENKGRKGAARC